ncbi:MAG TPA: septal ring lytic transglycosylase RlpA family protein [Rhizomicrobium sp.]|nr:septal ring lytic transglycosylase RlpA family protein [Rhizomicrobium sp.]
MLRSLRPLIAVCSLAVLAAACSSTGSPISIPKGGGYYKVGKPYQINGTWYYPKEQPDYDETGIASWYGPTFYGKKTANGEIFDANSLSAAHRTLPMPVNVRVTNLGNGKSVVVRVNDRGPYAKGRIIDLSERAAQLLGYYRQGTARVRVTYLGRASLNGGPPPQDLTPPVIAKAVPAAPTKKIDTAALDIVPGTPVASMVETAPLPMPAASAPPSPISDQEPTGEVDKVAVPAVTHLYVQAGAFSDYQNAARLQSRLGGKANGLNVSPIVRNGVRLYRVRMGPFNDVNEADEALARLSGLGNNDAQIVVDR